MISKLYSKIRKWFYWVAIKVHLYEPSDIAIFVHGGGWIGGSTEQFEPFADEFESLGWKTYLINYPTWPKANVSQQEQFVGHQIESIRRNNPFSCIVAIGGSAGGQLTLFNTRELDAAIGLNPALNVCADVEKFAQAMDGDCKKHYPSQPHCPVLIIHGLEDQMVPVSYAEEYKIKYDGVLLRTRDGVGHGWFNNYPESISEEIENWIDDVLFS